MKERKESEMLMTFTEFDAGDIHIKQAWMATNASAEVDIYRDTDDMFEVWVGSTFMDDFLTFEEAVRHAEALVPVKIKWED